MTFEQFYSNDSVRTNHNLITFPNVDIFMLETAFEILKKPTEQKFHAKYMYIT